MEPPNELPDARMTFNEQTEKWTYSDQGVSYEYDANVKAWFPMFNQELLESQQSIYAVEGVDEQAPAVKLREKKKRVYTYEEAPEEKKKPKKEATKKPNTSVYITHLPLDVTPEEMKKVFSKCGVIMEDLETGEPKIKLYRDEQNRFKGDALVTYFKAESVSLAVRLLDESELRPGDSWTMRVQKAEFKEKQVDPAKKAAVTVNTKAKKKLHQLHRKLDWVDEEEGKRIAKFSKIVVLKHMYTQEELDEDPALLLELKEEVREECETLGEVSNVILYDKSPGGIITVRFMETESANACVLVIVSSLSIA
ncbi:hypothetical protein BDF14DRAFT_1792324 [Spinellus fusiger]|nr:hypothetical protein BDF14DRAFT_1792324 [Spinellus fusiger]